MSDGLCEPRRFPHIEEELEGFATQIAPTGWLSTLFTRHDIEAQSSSTYLEQSSYYKCGRWDFPDDKGELEHCWEEEEDALDVLKILNGRIQHRFMDILNDVLRHFGFGDARLALATEPTADERDDILLDYDEAWDMPDYSTRPDLIILGQDAKQLPWPLESYNAAMSTDEEQRRCRGQGGKRPAEGRV